MNRNLNQAADADAAAIASDRATGHLIGHAAQLIGQVEVEPATPMRVPYIIAEAGSCHEETLARAIQLVQIAVQAGADCVKFQFWSSPARMRERRGITAPGAYATGSVQLAWLPHLRRTCVGLNVALGCSIYLPEDVPVVAPHLDVFKVSSFEALDRELIADVLAIKRARPLFISTGMQEAREVHTLPRDAILLHCVSAYPCPLEEANLGAIEPHEGYSDHTRCVFTGGLAVASGADYLEVHCRLLDTAPACADHVVALSPAELGRYIEIARAAALMRGSGVKAVQECERANLRYRRVT